MDSLYLSNSLQRREDQVNQRQAVVIVEEETREREREREVALPTVVPDLVAALMDINEGKQLDADSMGILHGLTATADTQVRYINGKRDVAAGNQAVPRIQAWIKLGATVAYVVESKAQCSVFCTAAINPELAMVIRKLLDNTRSRLSMVGDLSMMKLTSHSQVCH